MNTIISKTLLLMLSTSLFAKGEIEAKTTTLDDFDTKRQAGDWIEVNDGVMGGLSKGGLVINKEKWLVFSGEISLENNGGFSSIRSGGKTLDLSKYAGLEIKVKGDGRKYYLTARSDNRRMLAFWSPIQPAKGEWAVIKVPFSSFYATYFGKKVPLMNLNTEKITSVGFMLYDKKAGAFSLEAEYIKAYKKGE